jgi:hypothetical protein
MIVGQFGNIYRVIAATVFLLFHPAFAAAFFMGRKTKIYTTQFTHAVMPLYRHPRGGGQVAEAYQQEKPFTHSWQK